MKIGVMKGELADFDLATILQTVGLGRQYMGIEVGHEDGVKGTIFVKSGKIVQIESQGGVGAEALGQLLQAAKGSFYVFRSETPKELPAPLGAIDALLMMATAATPVAPAVQSKSAAPPLEAKAAPPPPVAAVKSARTESKKTSPPQGARVGLARTLGVVSPKGGCGKSTIALNVALSLARRGHSVVLVDTDINGDILSALDARGKAEAGVFDCLQGRATLAEAKLSTAMPQLKIIPALGRDLPDTEVVESTSSEKWQELLEQAAVGADLVIVDTPAGMFGTTRHVLSACDNVVGVLQAEAIAERSFGRFVQALEQYGQEAPPVLGVVLNMLQTRAPASLSVFQNACGGLAGQWLFDTVIPRHAAFLEAAHEGLPLRPLDGEAPSAVAFLFDSLASEIADRCELVEQKKKPLKLL